MLGGFRFFPSYIRVGGLREDIPRGYKEAVKAFLDRFPGKLDEYETLITKNPIWLDRTRGVGVITLRGLLQVGLVRPDRARGRRRLRRAPRLPVHAATTPTSSTSSAPRTATSTTATCARVAEMRESVKICHQALERIAPVGAWACNDKRVVPPPKDQVYTEMEALIQHFLIYSQGFTGAGRRRLCSGRRAARRAWLLRRVRRHQPPVARAHARPRPVSPARRCTSSSSAA